MDELYTQYGKLMIELEILQGRISGVKQLIAKELNQKESDKPAQ